MELIEESKSAPVSLTLTHFGATGLCETSKVVIERWSRFYNVRAGLEILKCRWGVRHIFAKRMGL
ncbi:MAG: hypothetical protein ACREEM_35585, partial [Blastocatellia bacterium]